MDDKVGFKRRPGGEGIHPFNNTDHPDPIRQTGKKTNIPRERERERDNKLTLAETECVGGGRLCQEG